VSYCQPEEAAQLDSSLDASDDITPEMLQWADAQVDEYLGRTYVSEVEVTENVDGNGSPTIRVSHSPVTSVSAIVVENTTQPASTWVFYSDGRLSLEPLPVELSDELGDTQPVWPDGRQNIAVTYKYGTVAGVRLPGHVQFAAAQITALIAKNAKMGALGPVGEDWKVGAISFKVKADKQLSAAIHEVLEETLGKRPPRVF
jgi:hypothetical protein